MYIVCDPLPQAGDGQAVGLPDKHQGSATERIKAMIAERIEARIEAPAHERVVVLGVGNTHRHDDGVGVFVARRVRREASEAVKVLDDIRDSIDLLEAWEDADTVIVVDAISSGVKPGTIYKIEVGEHPLPEILCRYSSHNLSIREAIGLSRAL